MAHLEVPVPDYDDPKEVYAFFGLTFYWAQVLEQGLVNLAVALQAKGIPGVTFKDGNELSGYSAAQANHLTWTLSSQTSRGPPSIGRPVRSQCKPVRLSTNGAASTSGGCPFCR